MNNLLTRLDLWLGSTAIALSLAAAPAQAQTAPQPDAAALPEVVVTAQRRSENIQTVPVAVTVVGVQALQASGIANASGLDHLVPSLTFKAGTTNLNATLAIRGIGTQSFASGAEPSVATVVDGVVYGRAGMAFQDFSDLDHIEVLQGPQGTLFGKNASAGVVSMITKAPSNHFNGDASVSYYEGDEVRVAADVSGPVSDRVAVRLSGVYGDYHGNIFNTADNKWTNGYQHLGVRGAVSIDFTDNLTFIGRADYSHAHDNCCADVLGAYVPSAQLTNVFIPSISPVVPGPRNMQVDNNLSPQTEDSNGGLSGEINYKKNGFTITSITAWRDWRNKQVRDGGFNNGCCTYVATGTPAAAMDLSTHDFGALNFDQFSEELRVASPTHQFIDYVVGGFLWYTNENDWFNRVVNECTGSTLPIDQTGFRPCSAAASTFLSTSGPAVWNTQFYNQAVFGQATMNLSDRLRLIGGLRYTHDRVTYNLNRQNDPVSGPGISAAFASSGATSQDGISAKAGVQYDITRRVMAYFTYSRGYKGPAFNVFYNMTALNTAPLSPETSDAYEIGLKSELLDRRLTLNASAFYDTFDNFQANNFIVVNGSTTTNLTNAGQVRSEGVELEATWRVTHDLTFNGGYTYDHAYIVAYNCSGLTGSNLTTCTSYNGGMLPFAPKHKLNVTGDWRLPLSDSLPFDARVTSTYSYSSLINFDIAQTPLARQPAYGLLDATIAFATKDDRYRLSVIGKNLTNQFYTTFITPSGNGVAAGSYTRLQIPRDAQRYFGVSLSAKF